jgi:uncharacterized protein
MKTPPAYLDDSQVDRLSELLELRAVPFRGFNLEALDGYLSALVVGPELVPPSEWQPRIWGPKPPNWEDEQEALEVQSLLMGHWNTCAARARQGEDMPEHLSPLLWLPEDPMAEQSDELDVGHDWAIGFFLGVDLREQAWDGWLDREDWIEDIFALLEQLASGEVVHEDPTQPPTPIGYRERLEIIASLPGMLADLHDYRIERMTPRTPARREAAPDRNGPCPCGSGRKYKKCCGAN